MTPRHTQAAGKAAAFLAGAQAADGSFQSFSSPARTPFTPELTYQTTFTPAIILGAIAGLSDSTVREVRRKLAAWLLAQKSPYWSFNYWSAAAPERQALSYPDDLDDTFCALIALYRHDRTLVGQAVLAAAVKLLIAAESRIGGPYRTWLAADSAPKIWHDIDLAVNANIAGFLRLAAEPLPNLTRLMEQAIANRSFSSPYYPSQYPVIYYIARAYDGPLAAQLADHLISKRRGGWWGSPLPTALAVSALTRLGRADACSAARERLIAAQQPDGSWLPEAFCIDPAVQHKTHYSGAAALTTALALEALQTWAPAPNTAASVAPPANKLQQEVLASIHQQTRRLSPALRPGMLAVLERSQTEANGREIMLLADLFNQSLTAPVPDAPVRKLGAANLYGWMAYTIYDDFLDGEGKPELLPAANAAMRQSLAHFADALPGNAGFADFARRTFDRIDAANAWELAHCRAAVHGARITLGEPPRYPSTLYLAERSLGHTLPAMGVLAAAGISPSDPRAQRISLALRHYIAARQLSDDLHDWEQDLRAGIITYVVAKTLNTLSIKPDPYSVAKLVPRMQKTFWHHTLPAVCQTITRHTALARQNACASGLLQPKNLITELADKIDKVVRQTLQEQSDAQAFLNAYANPTGYTESSPKNSSASRQPLR